MIDRLSPIGNKIDTRNHIAVEYRQSNDGVKRARPFSLSELPGKL